MSVLSQQNRQTNTCRHNSAYIQILIGATLSKNIMRYFFNAAVITVIGVPKIFNRIQQAHIIKNVL